MTVAPRPAASWHSRLPTPPAAVRTSTSPAPGTGSRSATVVRTFGGPYESNTTRRISAARHRRHDDHRAAGPDHRRGPQVSRDDVVVDAEVDIPQQLRVRAE